ncbi:leucine-rich repeat domain-containing protein [Companilactobacillus sp. HBUAS59699]|uniref:leucine-rich repeat domain-containing protein n=1 Tax=Companilactobacillus sp. HBUAS59699 TaxID=3109358 RepID=UPI002FF1B9A7
MISRKKWLYLMCAIFGLFLVIFVNKSDVYASDIVGDGSSVVDSNGISNDLKKSILPSSPDTVTPDYIRNMKSYSHGAKEDSSDLKNISGLNYGTQMESISLINTGDLDLTPISNLTNLKKLDLSYCGSEDISPVSNLTNLQSLNLYFSEYARISKNINDLSKLNKLTYLNLGENIGSISDVSALKNMSKLNYLNLDGTRITNLNDLSNLKSLSTLSVKGTSALKDISGVSNLNNLQSLNIDGNEIYDFSSLKSKNLSKLNDVNLGVQNIDANEMYIKGDSFSFDISKYIQSDDTPKITIEDIAPGDLKATYNPDTEKVDVSNFKKTSSNLIVGIKEDILINGKECPVTVFVLFSFDDIKNKPGIIVQDINLNQNDSWDVSAQSKGIKEVHIGGSSISANDQIEQALKMDGSILFVKDSNVNTKIPGKYYVTYCFSEGNPVYATANVYVHGPQSSKPSKSSNHSEFSNDSDISSIDKLTLITKKSDSIPIYNQNGEKISDQTLNKLTKFNVTQKNVVDGETYYEISDGNWIKASDVRDYTKESGVLQTESNSNKFILNCNGIRLNRALKETTDWIYDGSAEFDGTKYYRVATDEWVSANDVVLYNKINGVVKANVQAQVYKDTGEKSNRALAKNSEFVTDKISKSIDGETMYRVATDEWVKASDVTFK